MKLSRFQLWRARRMMKEYRLFGLSDEKSELLARAAVLLRNATGASLKRTIAVVTRGVLDFPTTHPPAPAAREEE